MKRISANITQVFINSALGWVFGLRAGLVAESLGTLLGVEKVIIEEL